MSITSRYGLLRQNHKTNLKKISLQSKNVNKKVMGLATCGKKLIQNIIHTHKKILIIPDQLHQ